MSNPCHIEVIVSEADEAVAKAPENKLVKLSAKQRGRSLAEQRRIAA
jgi:large subunit ribosomal protein L17e